MNILYAINSSVLGGAEYHILDLVKGMHQKGHNIFLVCSGGNIAKDYEQAGAKVIVRPIRFDLDPAYIFFLTAFIKKNKVDIVHAHELKAGVNATLAAKLSGVRLIITHIHTPMSEWKIEKVLKRYLVNIEIKFYAFFVNHFSTYEIALTQSRKQIKIKEGIRPEKIKVIPNGIDITIYTSQSETKNKYRNEIKQRFGIPENALVLGYVGRMTPEKGHVVLLEAFSKFMKSKITNLPIYLFLAGGGSLEKELKQKAVDLGLKNVVFTGVFDRVDIPKFYAAFDFFVFPTLAEGFGLVLAEAMFNELPSVVSDLAVLKEVGGTDVTYFKTGDSDDLAKKIEQTLINAPKDHTGLGKKLLARATDLYSFDKFINNYLDLYESFITR